MLFFVYHCRYFSVGVVVDDGRGGGGGAASDGERSLQCFTVAVFFCRLLTLNRQRLWFV